MPTGSKPGAVRKAAARISRSVQEAEEERRRRRQVDADLKECKREGDDAHKTLNKEQSEFDKQLLTLSAGFLGLALAFIKDVVPLQDAIQLWALYAGVILLGFCVFAVLLSLRFSVTGHFVLKAYWEKKQQYHSAPQEQEEKLRTELNALRNEIIKHDDRLKFVNGKVSGWLFSLGVVALIFFVIANIGAAHVRSFTKPVTATEKTGSQPSESKPNPPIPQTPDPTTNQQPAKPSA